MNYGAPMMGSPPSLGMPPQMGMMQPQMGPGMMGQIMQPPIGQVMMQPQGMMGQGMMQPPMGQGMMQPQMGQISQGSTAGSCINPQTVSPPFCLSSCNLQAARVGGDPRRTRKRRLRGFYGRRQSFRPICRGVALQEAQHVLGRVLCGNGMRALWQPFTDIMVGFPNEPIPADVCQRMGVPFGACWGSNASEMRRIQMGQSSGGMHNTGGGLQIAGASGIGGIISTQYGQSMGQGMQFGAP